MIKNVYKRKKRIKGFNMKIKQWMVINRKGIVRVRKAKPGLDWNEIAMQIELNIPDELFKRPTLEATLTVKDVPNTVYNPEIIINTKDLIEQQTGAKIDFRIIHEPEAEK
jgi:hypothetical protein